MPCRRVYAQHARDDTHSVAGAICVARQERARTHKYEDRHRCGTNIITERDQSIAASAHDISMQTSWNRTAALRDRAHRYILPSRRRQCLTPPLAAPRRPRKTPESRPGSRSPAPLPGTTPACAALARWTARPPRSRGRLRETAACGVATRRGCARAQAARPLRRTAGTPERSSCGRG
eukprot:scaffold2621_cov64-Phaeocystis_antarctica.AAC.5